MKDKCPDCGGIPGKGVHSMGEVCTTCRDTRERTAIMNDNKKCPKCGAAQVKQPCTAAEIIWECGTWQAVGHEKVNVSRVCLERQLAAKTAECEQAQAACAGMRGEMDRALVALDKRDYDTVRYWIAPVDESDNPGQPIIDRLANLEAVITAMCGDLLYVDIADAGPNKGKWEYLITSADCWVGGPYDNPVDTALAGLADMRKQNERHDNG